MVVVWLVHRYIYCKYANLQVYHGQSAVAVSKGVLILADGMANENFKRALFCCIEIEIETLLTLFERI